MMGGPAGMGGGSMLRAMGRAVGAGLGGVKDALSATGGARGGMPTRMVSVTSSVSSPPHPSSSSSSSSSFSATSGESRRAYPCFCDEWEAVDEQWVDEEGEDGVGFSERYIFGPAPTREEAEEAVAALQQIFVPITSTRVLEEGFPSFDNGATDNMKTSTDIMRRSFLASPESDWIKPSTHLLSSRSQEHDKVLDAFHLLQINPSIQRMVVSLSSDKAVWDAVLKNDVVQEIKKSFYEVGSSITKSSGENPDIATGILRWVLDNAKAKIVEFIRNINKIVNELFHAQERDKDSDLFDTALRSSFMLSVMVFIVVIVMRVQGA